MSLPVHVFPGLRDVFLNYWNTVMSTCACVHAYVFVYTCMCVCVRDWVSAFLCVCVGTRVHGCGVCLLATRIESRPGTIEIT